jgi:hypothetical protein
VSRGAALRIPRSGVSTVQQCGRDVTLAEGDAVLVRRSDGPLAITRTGRCSWQEASSRVNASAVNTSHRSPSISCVPADREQRRPASDSFAAGAQGEAGPASVRERRSAVEHADFWPSWPSLVSIRRPELAAALP